jgi:NitT/TauT family transport system substrate-binding protein
MRRLVVTICLCFAAAGVVVPFSGRAVAQSSHSSSHALTKVVVATGFMPDVLFAPYYVAQDLGFYKAQGLDVQMNYDRIPDLLQEVGSGKYTFAVQSGDSVAIARSTGVPVTYIMAQYEKYPIGAMTLKHGGVPLHTPADLKGRNIGFSAPGSSTYFGLRALLKAGHLTEKDITETSIGFTETESLVQKRIDIAMTYIDNEPVQARALGYPVTVLPVSRYENLVSNGVVTSTSLMNKNPGLVQRFVTATLKGLRYTLQHPNKAFTISMKRQPQITSAAQIKIQREILTSRLKFQQPVNGHPLGWSNPASWKTTITFLRSIGSIKKTVSVNTLYTDIFTNTFAARARA